MKIKKIKTFDEAIKALEELQRGGGIRHTTEGKIIPLSAHAQHIAQKAEEIDRWKAFEKIEGVESPQATKRLAA